MGGMPTRKVLSVAPHLSIWFENGQPRYSGRGLSRDEALTCVREWVKGVAGFLDECSERPDNAFRKDVRERLALAEESVSAVEEQDGTRKEEDTLARIVNRLISRDPIRIMRERRDPATGALVPPASQDEATTYYGKMATITVELRDIDF
jgi:hypothetical protein